MIDKKIKENMDLAEFLKKNCEYVSDEEQKELEELLAGIDMDDLEGVELKVEDII